MVEDPIDAAISLQCMPDDPTLVKPWKEVIDGRTGLLYYWNPETNMTQFERPSSLLPPLAKGLHLLDHPALPKPWRGKIDERNWQVYYWNPETNMTQSERPTSEPLPLRRGLPRSASTPMLANIPGPRMQSYGIVTQPGQQTTHTPQEQGQQNNLSKQPPQMMPQVNQQHSSLFQAPGQQQKLQFGYGMQPQGNLTPQQIGQQAIQQASLQSGQPMFQQAMQQMQQPSMQQLPGQQMPLYQGSQIGPPNGHHFTHPQMQYRAYQQTILPQGQQSSLELTQNSRLQGHAFPYQQEQNAGPQPRDNVDSQQGKQFGFSQPEFQRVGWSSVQALPSGADSIQMQQMGVQPSHAQQFGGSSLNLQPSGSLGPLLQSGSNVVHQQHGPRFQNPSVPPENLKMGSGESAFRRAGNEDMRVGALAQNVTPAISGPSSVAGPNLHNMIGHAMGGPAFPGPTQLPPLMNMERSDATNLSAVEVHRQHEATVCSLFSAKLSSVF
ncbi:hypothetical protein Vadar_017417 [Vaccinium darrowii]|uniref:Uncharacterized protein n=1 Tax=Vaccinium darrowii TaxID=229202 RepID=A0ACB7XI46_9ERIC|nr:hypothetical protein Vadar_017417 [Vaccinium darrowii]